MLEAKSMAFAKALIKKYYEKIVGLAPDGIEKREFGFGDFEKKISYRHYSFKGEKSLKEYLLRTMPPFVSCSAAFYEKPDARDPMESKKLLGSDLVFDLDANDIKLACRARHGSAWVCDECLDAVKEETIKLVEDFLVPDFAIPAKDISINFSGNRGYHVHVANQNVYGLSADARKQIADYVSGSGIDLNVFFPALGRRGVKLEGPKPTDSGWGGKLANGVITALNSGESSLLELGIDRQSVNMLVRKRADIIFGITTGNWDKVNVPRKSQFWENVLKGIAIQQSESIDRGVVNDIYHLIRLPGTLHGDTGLIAINVRGVKELEKFEPMDDAIAFRDGTVKVRASRVPEFEMNGTEYGPFDGDEVELPIYAGAYLVLKRLATVV